MIWSNIMWWPMLCCGVMVITTTQHHSLRPRFKSYLRRVGDSRWWRSLTMIPAGIRPSAFRRSIIRQKQFIIIIIIIIIITDVIKKIALKVMRNPLCWEQVCHTQLIVSIISILKFLFSLVKIMINLSPDKLNVITLFHKSWNCKNIKILKVKILDLEDFISLKELRNCVLCIIRAWLLFCSIRFISVCISYLFF